MGPTLDIHQLERGLAVVQAAGVERGRVGGGAGGWGPGRSRLLGALFLLGPHEHCPEGWTLRIFCLPLTESMVLASQMILVNCKSCVFPSKACTLKVSFFAKMETSLCAFLCF